MTSQVSHTASLTSSNQSSQHEMLNQVVSMLQALKQDVDRIKHHIYLSDTDCSDLKWGGTDPD